MTWLSEHLIFRRGETVARKRHRPEASLRSELKGLPPTRNLADALRDGRPAVIAEIKFHSPSQGELRSLRDVEAVAMGYHRAGAAALSVLVDARHFDGEIGFLGRAKAACPLPILAKGFFVDPYDLLEMRAAGADAVLLIAQALTRDELKIMLHTARELGLATLMELHHPEDLAKVDGLNLDMVGVNHRNLDTLEMDAGLSRRLVSSLPVACVKVAESGLKSAADFRRMAELGYDAVLVGTAFMGLPDPGQGLAQLLEECHACR